MATTTTYEFFCFNREVVFRKKDSGTLVKETRFLRHSIIPEYDYVKETITLTGLAERDGKPVQITESLQPHMNICGGFTGSTPVEVIENCEMTVPSSTFLDLVNCVSACLDTCCGIHTPQAEDDLFIGSINQVILESVTVNDYPCTEGTTTYGVVPNSAYGGVVTDFNSTSGVFEFTPELDYVGNAGFKYNVFCGGILIDTASVTIAYPDAEADARVDEETGVFNAPFVGDVSANDVPCTIGATTTYAYVENSSVNGEVSSFNNNTGVYTFTPDADFVGLAEFEYNILCDGIVTDKAKVLITYFAPTADAVDDTETGEFDGAFAGFAAANDTPCSVGDTTYVVVENSEVGGSVVLNSITGSYVFSPDDNFVGVASFQYVIKCDGLIVDTATASITYPAPDVAANDDVYTVLQDTALQGNVSTNDSPCSVGETTYAVVSGSASNGVVSAFNTATGAFTFTPTAGFTGNAAFSYQVLCNGLVSDTAQVTITVSAITASASNDAYTTPFATVVNGDVSTNDTPCNQGVTTYAVVAGSVSSGTLNILNPDGTFTYTPGSGFTGNATFQYNILCDGSVSDTGTVTITVLTPVTDAVNDTETMYQDSTISSTVSTNDTPCVQGVTTYAYKSASAINGTVDSFNPINGNYTFTPTPSFVGVASFQYEIYCDGVLADAATVTITVEEVTADAVDDTDNTTMSTVVSGNVISNDVPCNEGTTTYTLVPGSAVNGSVGSFDASGNFSFTPTTGFIGTASFQYYILCDGIIKDTATVSIVVAAPTANAVNDSNNTLIDTPVNGSVDGNDTPCSVGTTTYAVKSGTSVNGVVTSFNVNNGDYIFDPTTGFTGLASFQYNILCDGNIIDTAQVSITVSPYSADAVDDTETTEMSELFNGDVSTNDTTCSGGATTTYAAIGGTNVGGALNFFNTNGTYQFSPTTGFIGNASFQYRILCNGLQTDIATVNIIVTEPTADAVNDAGSTLVDTQLNGNISLNDTPCSSGVTTYALVTGSVVNGTLDSLDTSTGAYLFTPSAGYSGLAGFDYQILCDGNLVDVASVIIEVVTADAINDSFATAFATAYSGTVTGNDTVCNYGVTTYEYVAGSVSSGTVSPFNSDGTFTYTPDGDETGSQTFQYRILCDGVVVDTATVAVVVALPSASAVDDSFTTIIGVDLNESVPSNDTPCTNGVTTYQYVAGSASSGTVSAFDNAGNFTYQPASIGTAMFQYNVLCNGVVADTGTVTITVDPVSADAVNDSETVAMSTQLTGADVASNDTPCNAGTTTYTYVTNSVTNGTMDSFNTATGEYTFTPTTGLIGIASFQYEIRCNGVVIDTALVNITVTSPTADAVADSFTGVENNAYNGDVSTNDTPCSSGTTTYSYVAASATDGTMTTFNSDGTFTFTPDNGHEGAATFQYNILCDGNVIDTVTSTINFTPLSPTVAVSWSDVNKNDPDATEMTVTGTKDGSTALDGSDTVNLDIAYVIDGTPTTVSISGLHGSTVSSGDITAVESGTGIVIDPTSTYNVLTYAHPDHPGMGTFDADVLYASEGEDRRVRITASITSSGNTSSTDNDESYFIKYSWENGESSGDSGETDGLSQTMAGYFETDSGGGYVLGNSTNYINNFLDLIGGSGPFNHNVLAIFDHPVDNLQVEVDGVLTNYFGCDGTGYGALACAVESGEAASATSNGAVVVQSNCDGSGSSDLDTSDNCDENIFYNMPLTTTFAPGGGALGGDWGGFLVLEYTQADLGAIYFTPDLSSTGATGDPMRMIPSKYMR